MKILPALLFLFLCFSITFCVAYQAGEFSQDVTLKVFYVLGQLNQSEKFVDINTILFTTTVTTTTTTLRTTTKTTTTSTTTTTLCGGINEYACSQQWCNSGLKLNSFGICKKPIRGKSVSNGNKGCGSWALSWR